VSAHLSKGESDFWYPNRSISIQPPAHLAVSSVVGGTKEGAQQSTWNRNKLVFMRNPANSKAWSRQDLSTNSSQIVASFDLR
jgi:hypothetical protein